MCVSPTGMRLPRARRTRTSRPPPPPPPPRQVLYARSRSRLHVFRPNVHAHRLATREPTHTQTRRSPHHIVYSCRPTNTQARRSSVTSPYRILVSTLCTGGGEEPAGQGPGRRSAAAVPGGAQPAAGQRQPGARGGGDTANKHSTDVESPPLPPLVCMSMYTQGKSCSYRHAEDDEDIQRWFECLFSMTLLRGGGRAREVRVRDAVGGADAGDH